MAVYLSQVVACLTLSIFHDSLRKGGSLLHSVWAVIDPLYKYYFKASKGRVVLSSARLALLWGAVLIVVFQGGRGRCSKVQAADGTVALADDSALAIAGDGAPQAATVAPASKAKLSAEQRAEEQHPQHMTDLLPSALIVTIAGWDPAILGPLSSGGIKVYGDFYRFLLSVSTTNRTNACVYFSIVLDMLPRYLIAAFQQSPRCPEVIS